MLAEIVESHSNNVAHLKSSSCGFGGIADEITKLAFVVDEGKAESAGHEENGTHYYSASCSNVEIENFKVKNEIESTKRYTEFRR